MKIDDGGFAFPLTMLRDDRQPHPPAAGMSLRAYFAAAAMQGILADPEVVNSKPGKFREFADKLAEQSVELADALIARLKTPAPEEAP